MLGEFVLVRTRDAGVQCGTLQTLIDTVCTLADARRIWRWRGANTVHELSLRGAAEEWTRISEPVPVIYLSQVIEVIPCSEEARKNLSRSRWSRE
jgi:hypothetical protein